MDRFRELAEALKHPDHPTRVQGAPAGRKPCTEAAQHRHSIVLSSTASVPCSYVAEAIEGLDRDALDLPEELQEAVQCYVLGSGSQVRLAVTMFNIAGLEPQAEMAEHAQ